MSEYMYIVYCKDVIYYVYILTINVNTIVTLPSLHAQYFILPVVKTKAHAFNLASFQFKDVVRACGAHRSSHASECTTIKHFFYMHTDFALQCALCSRNIHPFAKFYVKRD